MQSIIFDCDGVLVDSEKLSCAAWLPVLARRGLYAELAEIEQFVGKTDMEVLEYFRAKSRRRLPDVLIDERLQQYFELTQGTLRPFPALVPVLEELQRRAVPCAVASSGRPAKIDFNLAHAGLARFFEVVCSVTQVQRGKPAPDLFLLTAEQLGAPPGRCTVIEDSIFGIQAARAASMTAIGFTSSHSAAVLREAGAQAVFTSYRELLDLLDTLNRPAA
jgi:HAD superfamily hydrolase (TIGR01509 family)